MEFSMKVDMDNAAFDEMPLDELKRVLDDVKDKLEKQWGCKQNAGKLFDSNGNMVGNFEVN